MKHPLSNVRAVVSDRKIAICDNDTVKTWAPSIMSANDYYPGGTELRKYSTRPYNYKHQGQLTDSEIYGEGNSYSYTYRVSDARLVRFWSVDPLSHAYAFYSPYSFSGNRLSDKIELEGLEPTENDKLYYIDPQLDISTNKEIIKNMEKVTEPLSKPREKREQEMAAIDKLYESMKGSSDPFAFRKTNVGERKEREYTKFELWQKRTFNQIDASEAAEAFGPPIMDPSGNVKYRIPYTLEDVKNAIRAHEANKDIKLTPFVFQDNKDGTYTFYSRDRNEKGELTSNITKNATYDSEYVEKRFNIEIVEDADSLFQAENRQYKLKEGLDNGDIEISNE